ncbi:calmodulin-binding transcription activator 1-like protein [Lates japonicus]|uniref:Calmodulin-binding transcription activator 1-like protein n=1 Tax=Lates japonicus TaxID=270547 RepID=A0AAD3NJ34_LATJO|nr:calmodulin-binding transcription activator 1-like protein [Lates japonicus]
MLASSCSSKVPSSAFHISQPVHYIVENPDIVLVHYLNVPAIEDCGKPCGPILCSINTDKKEWAKWTKEELIGQLKPMFHGIKWTCSNGNSSSGFSVEQLVQQILDSHQTKPPPRTHNCLCTGTLVEEVGNLGYAAGDSLSMLSSAGVSCETGALSLDSKTIKIPETNERPDAS